MDKITNTIQNNALAALSRNAPKNVMNAISQASAKTGVNFAYMVQQASAESSFNPQAKAKTSSATGLYQFIESTWLNMIKSHGEKYGIDTEGKTRAELLNLRKDPETASLMAAELASENGKVLKRNWGGEVGSTELYFAHFLGAGKASSFMKAKDENPLQEAALLFPKAAAANRNVFFDRETGRGKSVAEVYAYFDKKFDVKDADIPTAAPEPVDKPVSSRVFTANHQIRSFGAMQRSYSPMSSYQQMVSNPIELMLLAQLELPIHAKARDPFSSLNQ